jgi:hypothetical protein
LWEFNILFLAGNIKEEIIWLHIGCIQHFLK